MEAGCTATNRYSPKVYWCSELSDLIQCEREFSAGHSGYKKVSLSMAWYLNNTRISSVMLVVDVEHGYSRSDDTMLIHCTRDSVKVGLEHFWIA